MAIETAFQNGSLAFIVLKVSLPQPYGDLSTVAPVAQLVITAIPLWIILGAYKAYEKWIKPKYGKEVEEVVEMAITGEHHHHNNGIEQQNNGVKAL